jgi:hypothetical protein
MIRFWLSSTVGLLLSAAALPAQVPDSAFEAASGSDRLYQIPGPRSLDWSAIAHAAMPDFNPSHPDTNLLRDNFEEENGSLIGYKAPLPASLPRAHYWVLADSGATEVQPRNLHGSIYVETSPPDWQVLDSVTYGGFVEAVPVSARTLGVAHFMLLSPRPLTIRSNAAAFVPNLQRTVLAVLESRRIRVKFDSTLGGLYQHGVHGVPGYVGHQARGFEIKETGQLFLMVRWKEDDCLGASALYDVTTGVPRFVTQNFGDCGGE